MIFISRLSHNAWSLLTKRTHRRHTPRLEPSELLLETIRWQLSPGVSSIIHH